MSAHPSMWALLVMDGAMVGAGNPAKWRERVWTIP